MVEDERDDGGRNAASERRAYLRFEVSLAGACSVDGLPDIACTVADMSMTGAAIRLETNATAGAAVTIALPQVGLLRGRVARVFDGGIAVTLDQGRPQRERLASFLTWLIARRLDPDVEEREHERIVPLRRIVTIALPGSPPTTGRIKDVSRSGVALKTTMSITLGAEVVIGSTHAVVVRLFEGGFAARFTTALAGEFDATIIL